MATITDNDLKIFQERARTELAAGCDVGSIAWDSVIRDLCNEVRRLRGVSKERRNCDRFNSGNAERDAEMAWDAITSGMDLQFSDLTEREIAIIKEAMRGFVWLFTTADESEAQA